MDPSHLYLITHMDLSLNFESLQTHGYGSRSPTSALVLTLNREAILIKHMIIGNGNEGSEGLQRAGNVWVTEEVRFDLEYAVTMLMTNDFDNVT